jgi:4-amino-4-deoxy-L-arabinose transferase-like glycosyltransferase
MADISQRDPEASPDGTAAKGGVRFYAAGAAGILAKLNNGDEITLEALVKSSFRRNFWSALIGICLFSFALNLLGLRSVPLWDRDEGWYAECSREMLQTGDWVVPRFLGDWRAQKPPLVYWLQAGCMDLLGDTPLAARLPSTVSVLLAGLLIGAATRHFTDNTRGLWTAFIYLTSGLAIASAKFCLTDGVMALFAIAGQVCLAAMYAAHLRKRPTPRWAAPVFWISLGLAGLTKGPQVLAMDIVTLIILLVLDVGQSNAGFGASKSWKESARWWIRLQPVAGVLLLCAVVGPWLVAIHRRAPGFLQELLLRAKAHTESSVDGHGQSPGYHLALIGVTFFPWSLLVVTAITTAWHNRRWPMIRFALAITIGPWIVMEFVRTKLPFYILPAFGGLAFLTADALVRCAQGEFRDLMRPIFVRVTQGWAVVTVGLGACVWVALKVAPARELPVVGMSIFSLAMLVWAGAVENRVRNRKFTQFGIALGSGMAICLGLLFGLILPNFQFLMLSRRLGNDLATLGATGGKTRVAQIDYTEPTLAYYQDGGAEIEFDGYLQQTNPALWPKWFVMTQPAFQRLPARLKSRLEERAHETGLNYSNGGIKQTVLILENTGTYD